MILAGDEASLYLQASLMRVWSVKGQMPVVRVSAGRDNTHFYGALNLSDGREASLQSAKMTGEVSALFLRRLLCAYPRVPLLLLWDRATWHKGEAVRAVLAAHPRLEVLWFPPGCPELNPQEQVWKAVREAVSHNHSQARLDTLASAFEQHLVTTCFPCTLLARHGYQNVCAMFK